jgi:hypothetical protein
MMRQHPMMGLWLGVFAAIALYLFFALEFVDFMVYALVYRFAVGRVADQGKCTVLPNAHILWWPLL